MVAVAAAEVSTPVGRSAAGGSSVPVHDRRLVAVSVNVMELVRPGSDLARLIEGFAEVDLLLVSEVVRPAEPGPVGLLCGAGDQVVDADLDDDDDDADPGDDVSECVARLGLPGLHLHRLGLRGPLGPPAEGDLVAALSELVGFDPEPGLYCLAPAPAPTDPGRTVINRAAQRIAQVYGIPVLRYRCLELSVVGADLP